MIQTTWMLGTTTPIEARSGVSRSTLPIRGNSVLWAWLHLQLNSLGYTSAVSAVILVRPIVGAKLIGKNAGAPGQRFGEGFRMFKEGFNCVLEAVIDLLPGLAMEIVQLEILDESLVDRCGHAGKIVEIVAVLFRQAFPENRIGIGVFAKLLLRLGAGSSLTVVVAANKPTGGRDIFVIHGLCSWERSGIEAVITSDDVHAVYYGFGASGAFSAQVSFARKHFGLDDGAVELAADVLESLMTD